MGFIQRVVHHIRTNTRATATNEVAVTTIKFAGSDTAVEKKNVATDNQLIDVARLKGDSNTSAAITFCQKSVIGKTPKNKKLLNRGGLKDVALTNTYVTISGAEIS